MGSSTLTRTDAFGVITKETTSGLCMRLVLGSIIGLVAHYVMGIHVQVANVVSVATAVEYNRSSSMTNSRGINTIKQKFALFSLDDAPTSNPHFLPLDNRSSLATFTIGKRGIGLIFSIFNVAFLPAVYLSQYLPSQGRARHQIIAISVMLLPVAVLLMGSNRFLSALILGNILDCVLEGPIIVHLLPWMQEQALVRYPHQAVC